CAPDQLLFLRGLPQSGCVPATPTVEMHFFPKCSMVESVRFLSSGVPIGTVWNCLEPLERFFGTSAAAFVSEVSCGENGKRLKRGDEKRGKHRITEGTEECGAWNAFVSEV